MNNLPLIIILPDLRSLHNVGSIFRTADAAGVTAVWTVGYTPYPIIRDDPRPPHVADRIQHQLAKTALGAETTVSHKHFETPENALAAATTAGYRLAALEQSAKSIDLFTYAPTVATALIVGNEVTGLSPAILDRCQDILEIPMLGHKESLNVSVATGITLYQLRRLC